MENETTSLTRSYYSATPDKNTWSNRRVNITPVMIVTAAMFFFLASIIGLLLILFLLVLSRNRGDGNHSVCMFNCDGYGYNCTRFDKFAENCTLNLTKKDGWTRIPGAPPSYHWNGNWPLELNCTWEPSCGKYQDYLYLAKEVDLQTPGTCEIIYSAYYSINQGYNNWWLCSSDMCGTNKEECK